MPPEQPMSLIEFARATMPATSAGTSTLNWRSGLPTPLAWLARATHLELTDGRQRWLRLLIFVVSGPAQDNMSRREGDICLVAAVNLTS
jgi:hypothetical protein